MSRLQLLFPLIFWAIWLGQRGEPVVAPWMGSAIYAMSLALVVVLMRRWARRAMRGTTFRSVQATSRFHQAMFAARWAILAIHGVALLYLGFGDLILATGITFRGHAEAPAALVSSIPVVLAWIGLIWAQYPLDRAIREQNALAALNAGESIFEPPSLRQYIASNARLQVLSLLAPVAIAILLRDAVLLALDAAGMPRDGTNEVIATLMSAGFVFIVGPEILRRELPVQRLPDSPLRDRLEAMCKRLGLRYREILVWRTHFSFCNAAVMGLVPRFRYILLSDLLLDTMDDRQVEAVFAHEAGHVMHRHMTWYVVFAVVFFLWLGAAETIVGWIFWSGHVPVQVPLETIMFGIGVLAFFLIFGSLSRSFERQADLFAARTISRAPAEDVQPDGVEVFNSALAHVARLNNMPLDARQFAHGRGRIGRVYASLVHHAGTWLHGSIRARMDYLRSLPNNPARTSRFDRRMTAIRIALLVALCSTTAWVITSMAK